MANEFFREYDRRDFLRMSLAGALGVSHSGWIGSLAKAAEGAKRPRACILLWMAGGPSQLDTLDPKPDNKNGGGLKAIETAVPGIRIGEHLPRVAAQMKDLAIVRSMTTKEGDHGRATQLMSTGYMPQESVQYPVLGSLVAKELGRADSELPNFVSVSPFRFGGAAGPGFLGPNYAPLNVSGDSDNPQARANLTVENLMPPPTVAAQSVQNRFKVLGFLQSEFDGRYKADAAKAHRANYDRAARMVASQAKSAFKLEEEPAALRDAYGRNRFGQGLLLARRLVERGTPFVEVTLGGVPGNDIGWDTHLRNFDMVKLQCGVLDPAWSTLMDDLKKRGMLESTLVVWMGEFGRTPRINEQGGRDHFPLAWSMALAGAGIRGGQVIGDTGEAGMEVKSRPVTAPELLATICTALDIDPAKENMTNEGRPISIVEGGALPVRELLG